MKPWTIDAAKILQSKSDEILDSDDLVITNRIRTFLDGDEISFVIAPKGFGKTLLLITKRLQYHRRSKHEGFTLIPDGLLVDVPKGGAASLDLGKLSFKFLSDRRNWEGIWRACLSLSIVSALKGKEGCSGNTFVGNLLKEDPATGKPLYPILRSLLSDELNMTPLSCLNSILQRLRTEELRSLLKEQEYLDRLVASFHTPVAIFIDNVDEYFEEHLEKDHTEYSASIRGVFDVNMWHLSQQGLMFAIKTMCRNNHHFDIFATIRKEAYQKLDGVTVENIRGYCLDDFEYSKAKMREMFIRNIRKTEDHHLAIPSCKADDPIRALCGFDAIEHASIGEEEDVFDYIYRRTLKRPRDVIRIGRILSSLDTEEHTVEVLREKINKAATAIAQDYIKICLPHTNFGSQTRFLDFLRCIPHNVLDRQALRRICGDFNGGCLQLSCKGCGKGHPFCDLYRLGLLGVVRYDPETDKYRQEFLAPGEIAYGENGILPAADSPESNCYLIHPTLNALIGGDARTRINRSVLVGDRLPWRSPLLPPCVAKYKVFFSYSHEDIDFVERLAGDLTKNGIGVWYDRRIEPGNSFIEEISLAMKESEYLAVVISENAVRSGWVKQEIEMAIQHEIRKCRVKVLPILIDGVWERVPPSIRDRMYADFRNGNDYEKRLSDLCHLIGGGKAN